MRTILRAISILAAAAVIAQVLWLWIATGGHMFTRYPSTDASEPGSVAQMESQEGSLSEAFEEPQDLADAPGGSTGAFSRPIINEFRFGLLPNPVLSVEALSVLSIGIPAAALGLIALWLGRSPRRWTLRTRGRE